MELKITCIPGDGIGPEIVAEAKKALDAMAEKYGHHMQYTDILMGGASIDVHGVPLTDEAVETARSADAVLMGSIGGKGERHGLRGRILSGRPQARPAGHRHERRGIRYEQLSPDGTARPCLYRRPCGSGLDRYRTCHRHILKLASGVQTDPPLLQPDRFFHHPGVFR